MSTTAAVTAAPSASERGGGRWMGTPPEARETPWGSALGVMALRAPTARLLHCDHPGKGSKCGASGGLWRLCTPRDSNPEGSEQFIIKSDDVSGGDSMHPGVPAAGGGHPAPRGRSCPPMSPGGGGCAAPSPGPQNELPRPPAHNADRRPQPPLPLPAVGADGGGGAALGAPPGGGNRGRSRPAALPAAILR